ncbi:MAG: diacylglycerol kinase family protein [bacterium]
MAEHKKFSLRARIRSFQFAWRGVGKVFRQHNFLIQFIVALVTILAGFIFSISPAEWIVILTVIALVLSLEALNTAIEYLVDFITKKQDPAAGMIKDIAAGAVLIASFFSVIIGLIIFLPKIIEL